MIDRPITQDAEHALTYADIWDHNQTDLILNVTVQINNLDCLIHSL